MFSGGVLGVLGLRVIKRALGFQGSRVARFRVLGCWGSWLWGLIWVTK